MQDIDDLLVRVQRKGQHGVDAETYVVDMWMEGGRRINGQSEFQLNDYVEPALYDATSLTNHGLDLFNRLFSSNLAIAFQQAWAAATSRNRQLRVRLALDGQAPALHAVPWELIHFDDSGGMSPARSLATDARVILSRYIESAEFNEGQPIKHRPIRMLVVISDPSDLESRWRLTPVNKANEERDLKTRFSRATDVGQLSYDFLPVASEEAFHEAIAQGSLDSYQPEGYDILFFLGHALHHDIYGSRLLLEDPQTGKVQLYNTDEFVGFMQKLPQSHRPALAILIACNSATVSPTSKFNSLAGRLVHDSGLPAVLAMQRLVEIPLARNFTHHLSEQLLREGIIDRAVNIARQRVFQPDNVGWSTPVLYMRNPKGQLFTPNAQLEHVDNVLRNPNFIRWDSSEFIDVGVLAIAPGQDISVLRSRPEDAPSTVSVMDTLRRIVEQSEQGEKPRRSSDPVTPRTNLTALIGPPHSGQTTILERLTFDLANQLRTRPLQRLGVFISLAGYENQRGTNRLERYIIDQVRATTPILGDVLSELFDLKLHQAESENQPHFVFLLDNLDALPEKARLEVARDLYILSRRLDEQLFIIASTQDNFPRQILSNAYVLIIQPLNEHQIVSYIRQRDEEADSGLFNQIRDNRLLALASDPTLLTLIYERLQGDPQAKLTRNQLIQEYLDRALGTITPRYSMGDAIRESLNELAWYSRWNNKEQLQIGEVFRIMASKRRSRDYNLEDLYSLFIEARLLTSIGQFATRFVNPALQAYCAAVALSTRSDFAERLRDIINLCSSPERLGWWEDVIYSLAGLFVDPVPLFENLAVAIRNGSYTHALIAARCMEALPPEQEARLPKDLRNELLDACMLRLQADREPIAERREQIVIALGRLNYPDVRHELRRILVDRVRQTSSGPRYEYTSVRIAAARALRNIYLPQSQPAAPPEASKNTTDNLLINRHDSDMATLSGTNRPATAAIPSRDDLIGDKMLVGMIRIWEKGIKGRDEFRDILKNSPNPSERAIAAFSIADLNDTDGQKQLDARALLRIILSPTDDDTVEISDDWEDTMWAAADALTLFEADLVVPLLTVLVKRNKPIPDSAVQQLAYLAGRLRANNEDVINWLITTFITNPNAVIKSKALQSLAWMGMGIPTKRLTLADGRLGPTLKQIIQDIAAARDIPRLQFGEFKFSIAEADGGGMPMYLRRKAIESLAWIGDLDTLKDLGSQYSTWPIELREQWYTAAATIKSRIGTSITKNGTKVASNL